MSQSGPNNTHLDGDWDGLTLPVVSWRVWTWESDALLSYVSGTTAWDDLPDLILCVEALHADVRGRPRRTLMNGMDGYPDPLEVSSEMRLGVQVGEVNGAEWEALRLRIFDGDP